MSIPVRQSTAFECSIGPVLDADGVAVTDCVVADFKLKKTTGNFAALNGSATLTHVSAGTYDLVLTTSDTDTVGLLTVAIDDTVNACAPVRMQVIEEAIYDALYAASANAFQGAAGSTKVTGVVLVDTLTTYTNNTPQTGDAFAYLGTNLGALGANATEAGGTGDHLTALATAAALDAVDNFVDTEISAIISELAKVPKSDGTASWNATALAAIQSEANDALVANNLDHLMLIAVDTNFATTVHLNSVIGHLADNGTSASFDRTTDSLEAADADRENIRNDTIEIQNLLTSTGIVVNSFTAGGVSALAIGVWDADATGHQTQGTFGQAIGDPGADSDSIWALVNTNLNATISSRASQASVDTIDDLLDTEVAAILAAVDTEIAAIVAAIGTPSNLGGGATLSANLADIEGQTDEIGTAGIGLSNIPWNASWDAEVQSEVTDALTTALTEGYRAHGATGSVAQLLYELLANVGNSTNSGLTKTAKKIDGTTAKTYAYDADPPTSIAYAS